MILSPSSILSKALTSQNIIFSRQAGQFPFALGQNVEAIVVRNVMPEKVLLQINDALMEAHTEIPLQKGERLLLSVESLRPGLVLKIAARDVDSMQELKKALKEFRVNPQSLKEWVSAGKDILGNNNLAELVNYISRKDLRALIKTINKMIIDKEAIANPLFLSDYIKSLGLDLEMKLRKTLRDHSFLSDANITSNSRTTLFRIQTSLAQLIFSSPNDELKSKLENILRFIETGAKVMEQLQIVNAMTLAKDQLLMLQLPLQCQGEIRMQDIFIETDASPHKEEALKKFRVVLFLDMDALGQTVCDISMENHRLNAVVKTPDAATEQFLNTIFSELKERLTAAGYQCKYLVCIHDKDVDSWKRHYLKKLNIYSTSSVDLSV